MSAPLNMRTSCFIKKFSPCVILRSAVWAVKYAEARHGPECVYVCSEWPIFLQNKNERRRLLYKLNAHSNKPWISWWCWNALGQAIFHCRWVEISALGSLGIFQNGAPIDFCAFICISPDRITRCHHESCAGEIERVVHNRKFASKTFDNGVGIAFRESATNNNNPGWTFHINLK